MVDNDVGYKAQILQKNEYLTIQNIRKMNKDKAIDTIKELPQEFELEELLEKLVFVEKTEIGLKQLKEGKTLTHAKAKEIANKW